MSETDHGRASSGQSPDVAQQLDDWVTIWQSELASLVLDREMQDTALRLIDGWAIQARAVLRAMAPAIDAAHHHHHRTGGPHRPAGPVPQTRAAPAADAPDAPHPTPDQPTSNQPTSNQPTSNQPTSNQPTSDRRDAAIRELMARVAELERRLAESIPAIRP